jgi:hypothetical protein
VTAGSLASSSQRRTATASCANGSASNAATSSAVIGPPCSASEPGYYERLSAESVRTLALQGGPMTADQVAAFEALPFAQDAVAVRRWDDEAKDPAVTPPEFSRFVPLLKALARS